MDLSSPPLSSDHHAPPNRQRPEKTCGTPRPPGPRPSGPATAGPPTTCQPTWPRCSRSRPESGPQQSHRLLNRSGNRIFTAHRRKGPDMRRPARPERLRPRTPSATGPGPPIAPTPDPHRKLPPFQTISRASRSRSRMTWWSSTSMTLVRLPVLNLLPLSESWIRDYAGHGGPAEAVRRTAIPTVNLTGQAPCPAPPARSTDRPAGPRPSSPSWSGTPTSCGRWRWCSARSRP